MPKIRYKDRDVEADDVGFTVVKEDWNIYQLHDGTEIRVRLIVQNVIKIPDEVDDQGNPAYAVRSSNIMVVKPSEPM